VIVAYGRNVTVTDFRGRTVSQSVMMASGYPDPVAVVINASGGQVPSESQPSDVLSEFARPVVTDLPIDTVVERTVDTMPTNAGGVTPISPGAEPSSIAGSNDAALRFEELQTELDEGPRLAAYHSGEAISVRHLGSEARSPEFDSRAADVGPAALFSLPLRHGDPRIGALDLGRDRPDELGVEARTAAQTLAEVTTPLL
jgi:hypothetical protein